MVSEPFLWLKWLKQCQKPIYIHLSINQSTCCYLRIKLVQRRPAWWLGGHYYSVTAIGSNYCVGLL